jgi:hypothetical protein
VNERTIRRWLDEDDGFREQTFRDREQLIAWWREQEEAQRARGRTRQSVADVRITVVSIGEESERDLGTLGLDQIANGARRGARPS